MKLRFLALILLCLSVPTQAASSKKKGFDVPVRDDGYWLRTVTALHAHWFYSWGGDAPKNLPRGVEFVPMDWGYYGNDNNNLVTHLAKVKAQPGVKTLLGFNEPDGKDQANISVEKALEGWPYLMQTGLKLGSPAAVHPEGEWMRAFMKGAEEKHYRVDYICVHSYGGSDPQSFLTMLKRVHDLYHRPIWITEFAVADWNTGPTHPNQYTPAQVAAFMKVVLPALEKTDYVQRYSWFCSVPEDGALGPSALVTKDGSLTELGRLYASY